MVKRTIYATWEDRMENDAEHSFQLAMSAWYLIDSMKLNLDISKILKYSLAHDLVETYAWDVFFYTSNTKELEEKEEKEQEAAKMISENYPEFVDLHKFIEEYEKREDEESKFVYALDKLLPVINTYLDEWRTWKEYDISLDILVDLKDMKISECKKVHFVWQDFVKIIKNKQEKLFDI